MHFIFPQDSSNKRSGLSNRFESAQFDDFRLNACARLKTTLLGVISSLCQLGSEARLLVPVARPETSLSPLGHDDIKQSEEDLFI